MSVCHASQHGQKLVLWIFVKILCRTPNCDNKLSCSIIVMKSVRTSSFLSHINFMCLVKRKRAEMIGQRSYLKFHQSCLFFSPNIVCLSFSVRINFGNFVLFDLCSLFVTKPDKRNFRLLFKAINFCTI